ncbi:MAG: hypothetical protein IJ751_00695, partial [Oscillospiraceae bacterium]|nr:hypothetical protein [Oscillospiraceae bacterium]
MKKLIKLALLLAAVLALFTAAASAANDPVGEFAAALLRQESEITVPVRDYDELLTQTFTRYPKVFLYYGGCSYLSTAEGLVITPAYRNTGLNADDVRLVHDREELVAVIGLAMADNALHLDFVVAGGYVSGNDEMNEELTAALARLSDEYALISMGYFSENWTTYFEDRSGVAWVSAELGLIDDIGPETLRQYKDDTEAKVLELSETLFAQDMPDYQKELLIHDYLVDNNRYDTRFMDDADNHLAYSALCEGKSVCQGYSEAAHLLLEAAGVPSRTISGTGHGEDHMWNCVQIDGAWYLLDITWDDPAAEDGSDLGMKLYDYFNVTEAQLSADHAWDGDGYPEFTATAMTYDAVREKVEADTAVYTDYSAANVRTQSVQRAELMAILDAAAPQDALPAEDAAVPVDAPQRVDVPQGDDTAPQDSAPAPDDLAQPQDDPDLTRLAPIQTLPVPQ